MSASLQVSVNMRHVPSSDACMWVSSSSKALAHCDQVGRTALHMAAFNGRLDCLVALVGTGASVDDVSIRDNLEVSDVIYSTSTSLMFLRLLGERCSWKVTVGSHEFNVATIICTSA